MPPHVVIQSVYYSWKRARSLCRLLVGVEDHLIQDDHESQDEYVIFVADDFHAVRVGVREELFAHDGDGLSVLGQGE